MKKSVQIERLTQLIRVLEEVKADKKPFNMWFWYRPLLNGCELDDLVGNKKHSCGTASCAAGWAAQDPWFKKRGFTLGSFSPVSDYFHEEGDKVVRMKGDGEAFEACRTFFGAESVFAPSGYCDRDGNEIDRITPSMVIARVKKLIKEIEGTPTQPPYI